MTEITFDTVGEAMFDIGRRQVRFAGRDSVGQIIHFGIDERTLLEMARIPKASEAMLIKLYQQNMDAIHAASVRVYDRAEVHGGIFVVASKDLHG